MIRPITVLLLAGLLPLAACEPREPREAPRDTPRDVATNGTAQLDDDAAVAPCTFCLQCRVQATPGQPAVMRTRAHELQLPGGISGPGAPVFRPLQQGDLVGVFMGVAFEGSARLRLSYQGCPAQPGQSLGIARLGPGDNSWTMLPGPFTVDEQAEFVETEIESNSRYAIAIT